MISPAGSPSYTGSLSRFPRDPSGAQFPQPQEPSSPSESSRAKVPKPEIQNGNFQAKVPKRKFPSESYRAKIPKRKITSESSQAKVPKRKFPSESSQAKVPKRKIPSEISQAKDPKRNTQAKNSKRKIPSERSQAKVPKRKIPSESSQAQDPTCLFVCLFVFGHTFRPNFPIRPPRITFVSCIRGGGIDKTMPKGSIWATFGCHLSCFGPHLIDFRLSVFPSGSWKLGGWGIPAAGRNRGLHFGIYLSDFGSLVGCIGQWKLLYIAQGRCTHIPFELYARCILS